MNRSNAKVADLQSQMTKKVINVQFGRLDLFSSPRRWSGKTLTFVYTFSPVFFLFFFSVKLCGRTHVDEVMCKSLNSNMKKQKRSVRLR